MLIELAACTVRDWRPDDAASLARHANDRRIWINMRDRFPYPYGLADARGFLNAVATMQPRTFFAIARERQAIGGIGYSLQDDVERVSAEIGYWLGVAFWGKGIMTSAVTALTDYAFERHDELRRMYAVPFDWNTASMRVLEKAGYHLEGRTRDSVIKDGKVTGQAIYAKLRTSGAKSTPGRKKGRS